MVAIEIRPGLGSHGSGPVLSWPDALGAQDGDIKTTIDWSLSAYTSATVEARDFFRMAASAYIADVATSKPAVSLHRDLQLTVHIENSSRWDGDTIALVVDLLHWLTGDSWELTLVETTVSTGQTTAMLPADRVQLLSGGLDSLCGAVIGLRDDAAVTFVGHRDAMNAVRHAQNLIRESIQGDAQYLTDEFYLREPSKRKNRGPRSRSLMFVALGALTASAASAADVWVPENGFTSINPPLDAGRGGALTTRSTHPYTFAMIRQLLGRLGIPISVTNPFQALTKGELVASATPELDSARWKPAVTASYSCAKGGTQRFHGDPNHNCGLCVACVVRRASFVGASVTDPSIYDSLRLTGDDLAGLYAERSRDIISIQRAVVDGISPELVLASGLWPIGTNYDEVLRLVDRGLKEVSAIDLAAP